MSTAPPLSTESPAGRLVSVLATARRLVPRAQGAVHHHGRALHCAAASLASVLLLIAPAAEAARAAVKAGSWDFTVTSRVSETRTQVPELGNIPARDRESVKANMTQPVRAPDTSSSSHECLSAQAAGRWATVSKIDHDFAACKRKVITDNSKQFKATLSCNGGKATGEVEFSASGDAIVGQTTLVSHESTYDRTESKLVKGTWLGATCSSATQQQ
jgi:Protein of unknown function (DUF3617)